MSGQCVLGIDRAGFVLSRSESIITESDRIPGPAVGPDGMRVSVAGEIGTDAVTVTTEQGGFTGAGARFVHQVGDGDVMQWRPVHRPGRIHGHLTTAGAQRHSKHQARGLSTGTVIQVIESSNPDRVQVVRHVDGLSAIVLNATGYESPSIVVAGDRVEVYARTTSAFSRWESSNDGISWSLADENVVSRTPTESVPEGVVCSYRSARLILGVDLWIADFWGSPFRSFGGADAVALDALESDAGVVVAAADGMWLMESVGQFRKVQSFDSGVYFEAGAILREDSGRLWTLLVVPEAGSHRAVWLYSDTEGVDWEWMGGPRAADDLFSGDVLQADLSDVSIAWGKTEGHLFVSQNVSGGTHFRRELGGYTTQAPGRAIPYRAGWSVDYVPSIGAAPFGRVVGDFAMTKEGTALEGASDLMFSTGTDVGETVAYSIDLGDAFGVVLAEAEFEEVGDTEVFFLAQAFGHQEAGLRLTFDSGSVRVDLVSVDSDTDVVTVQFLGSAVPDTGWIQLRLCNNEGAYWGSYRTDDGAWSTYAAKSALSQVGVSSADQRVRIRLLENSRVNLLGWRVLEDLDLTESNGGELLPIGRPWGPSLVRLSNDTQIAGVGVTREGDSWEITPTSSTPIEALEDPSPSVHWVAGDDSTQQVAFECEPQRARPLLVSLRACVARQVLVSIRSGVVWIPLGSASLSVSVGKDWLSYGNDLHCVAPFGSTRFVYENELAGGVVEFADGTTRKVVSNTYGSLGGGHSPATLTLDGPATAPGSDTFLWFPTALLVIWPTAGTMSGVRLDFGTAPGRVVECGAITITDAEFPSTQPDETRVMSRELAGEVVEADDGRTRTFRRRPDVREVSLSWIRTSKRMDYAPVLRSRFPRAAEYGSVPIHMSLAQVRGIIARVGRDPMIYAPSVDTSAAVGAVQVVLGSEGHLVGRPTPASLRIESTTGAPNSCGEVARGSTFTLREVV